jgi:hypothetical protein
MRATAHVSDEAPVLGQRETARARKIHAVARA